MATIQGIYIALFGRPADPLGLDYFEAETNGGADLTAIGDLAATAEYQARFEGMSNVQIINSIYQSLFGRDADLAGLTFFSTALQNGTYDINNIAIAILDGAQGDDLLTVNNKIEAANLFTASLDTGAEVVAYSGDGAAAQGRAFLSGVTEDDATVPTQAEVDAAIEAIVESPAGPGDIFTLTDGVDEVEGTAGNDTFRAVTTDALDSTDIIDGGAGNDVLNITAGSLAAANAPVLTSIETINNAGGDLDLAQVTGVNRINSSVATSYTNASLATVFAATAAVQVDIAYADSLAGESDTANVATALSAAGTATFEFGADAADIENVAVEAAAITGGGTTTVVLDTDLDDLVSVSVTGAGDVDLGTIAEVDFSNVDASAATGDVTVDLTGAGSSSDAEDLVVTMGAGDDTVTIASQEDATVNLGAGNDTLNIAGDEQGLSATLGAGTDSVVFADLANIADAAEGDFASDIISITDFNGSQDFLDLSAVGALVTLTNADRGSIEGEANLYDAVTAASGFAAAGEVVAFQFEGNTYLYAEDATDGFNAGDGLVELVGFTGALTAANSDFA